MGSASSAVFGNGTNITSILKDLYEPAGCYHNNPNDGACTKCNMSYLECLLDDPPKDWLSNGVGSIISYKGNPPQILQKP